MAESFINELPNDAATKSRLAVSDEGEINFSFEQGANCFRVIICDDAALSYYGLVDGREYFGDGVPLSDFPYMKLVQAL
ncbi:hypothetical protein NB691_001755 [Xanthomonas sacchari]|nr:hypothetical protein [Xanthomonas sacchari]